jgi:large subunit ribosomal protein L23
MEILIKPIITEKATAEAETLNRYAFVVHKEANKVEIRKAIEALYSVNVESVKTAIMPGKRKRRYTQTGMIDGNTGSYKKAIVEVRSGEMIDLYSNI